MTTLDLAGLIVSTPLSTVPDAALDEAARSFLNFTGVAISAAAHPMIDMVLDVTSEWGRKSDTTVIGRDLKVDPFTAALVNGMSTHIQDYDDTILDTVLHPSAPVFPALCAYAEPRGVSGRDFLAAFVLGAEVEQRVAQVVCPSHYDRGWHVTGSVGAFGAAAAVGKLMGLDVKRMVYALGLAATQPVGLREMFGTYTKPFHPGKSSANGLLAALLAEKGFTSSEKSIEALRGFAHVTSENPRLERLTQGWGQTWEILNNTYKPFPCGIVTHPAIDACITLHRQGVAADSIEKIDLYVHPLAVELTGRKTPRDGLEAKFSVFHCAAAGLIDGWVGLAQFTDERVLAPDIVSLRDRIQATVDAEMHEDQVRAVAHLRSGGTRTVFIEHAIGSKDKPMSNQQLEKKFFDVTVGIMEETRARQLMDAIWSLGAAESVAPVLGLTALKR